MQIVDRRLNPKAKSLGNRQRFIRRAKTEIREAVRETLKKRKISEVESGEKISIRSKSLKEPSFGHARDTGEHDFVLPGNQDFTVGDSIRKPPQGGGGGGQEGSADGSGQDDFVFHLTREEFLDLFFEDLKLPNMVKAKLKSLKSPVLTRAGFQSDGPPAKLNHLRTMRNSLARRVALRRPSLKTIHAAEQELAEAEAAGRRDEQHIAALKKKLDRLIFQRKTVAFIDPVDLRYNRFERRPRLVTQAVMFCLMDVSASMTEPLKELAKRFFMLLHLFLSRHYTDVEIVFIRHTTEAQEVDEATFFESTVTGGTVISTALEEMLRVVEDRYPPDDWNIYAAQASDGHNFVDDMESSLDLLQNKIIPICQYYAYIEVASERQRRGPASVVWRGYQELTEEYANFAMRHVTSPEEIYPVFRELFSQGEAAA
jgi:uncharacterized protein